MAEVKWIKIVTEFFDDEKIKIIEVMPEADMVLIIWIKLLTLAGKKNMNGYIFLTENIPYTDEMLATIFNRPVNTVRLALDIFKKFKMINYNGNGILQISNWFKHQNIDGLELIKEQSRKRVAKFREQHKKEIEEKNPPLLSPPNNKIRIDKIRLESNVTCNVTSKGGKIKFNYKTKNWENITEGDIKDWSIINPNCNVTIELEIMRQWLIDHSDHPKKLFRKFIVGWVKRAKTEKKEMTQEEALEKMEVTD